MIHFIYKTTSSSGKYYIGRHSTKKLNDGYFGSGKWIRSIKDKTTLTREILEFCDENTILEREQHYLKENVGKENCMNFNLSPVGFSSGNLNPAKSEEERKRRSLRSSGENNPTKRPEVREKMSAAQKGKSRPKWKMSEQGRKNISEARKNIKYSDEGRKKLSESRKKQYAEGKRKVPQYTGCKHSEESKKRMSEIALSRPILTCEHCGIKGKVGPFNRWHGNNCKKRSLSP
jgi:hypothetical protein